ncbi:hypothetical protein KW486_20890, partial [Vibrio fluvialis]|nr:hypothetical protein [Vibrio fluvialis]MBY8053528.1 hypothetical protein [Vibrio fluvialis]
RTESASGTLGHSFTCHAMRCILTPLIRWPNSPYHYNPIILVTNASLTKNAKDRFSKLNSELEGSNIYVVSVNEIEKIEELLSKNA